MTDLVAMMREIAPHSPIAGNLLKEAADEIERLRLQAKVSLDALKNAENALADYIPTIERSGASLHYGRLVLREVRAVIDASMKL